MKAPDPWAYVDDPIFDEQTVDNGWGAWISRAEVIDPAEIDIATLRRAPSTSVLVNEVPDQIVRIAYIGPPGKRGLQSVKVVNFAGVVAVLDMGALLPVPVIDAIGFLDDAALWYQILVNEREERAHLDEVNQDLEKDSPIKVAYPMAGYGEALMLWASHLTRPTGDVLEALSDREAGIWAHAPPGRVIRPPRDVGKRLQVQVDGDSPTSVGWYQVRPA